MIPRVIARWTSMLFTRKAVAVMALCILLYLYWMRSLNKVHITSPSVHSSKFDNARDKAFNNTRDNALYADFLQTWCLVRRMRTDWKQVLRPCAERMAWEASEGDKHLQNRTDAAQSYLIRWDIRPAGQFSRFDIQSVTQDNLDKTIGGDSWRVHIRGPSSLSPTVIDHNNGQYQVSFLVLEPGKYEVEVVLEYSLCDGYKDPPKDWFIKGRQ